MLKRYWVKISNLGIIATTSKYLKLRLRLINQVLFIICLISCFNIFIYFQQPSILLSIFIILLTSGVGLLISSRGKEKLIRHYFVIATSLALITITSIQEVLNNNYLFIFPWVAITFFLFKESKIRRFYLCFFVINLILLFSLSQNIEWNSFTPTHKNHLYNISISFFILVGVLYFFDLEYKRYNRILNRKQKKLDASQKETNLLYEGLYQKSPTGIAFCDAKGIIEKVNNKFCEITEYEEQEVVGLQIGSLIEKSMQESYLYHSQNAIENNQHFFNKISAITNKNRKTVDIDLTVAFNSNDHGLQSRVVMMMDISERVAAEKAKTDQEAYLRKIINIMPTLVFSKYHNGTYKLANTSMADSYNTTPEKMLGKTDWELNPYIKDVEFFRRKDREVFRKKQEIFIPRVRFTQHDGTVKWVQTFKTPIFDENGNPKEVLGIVTDITTQVETEQALRENEERYRSLFETNQAGIVVLDLDFNFTKVNPAFCKLSGYTKQELLRMNVEVLNITGLPTSKEALLSMFKNPNQPAYTGEIQYEQKGNEKIFAQINITGEYNKEVNLIGFIATVIDLTERKRAENHIKKLLSELKQKHKELEAQSYTLYLTNNSLKQSNIELEQFAYIASHDLQEPLRMIGNFVQLLEIEYEDKLDEEGKMYIDYAVDGVTRMSGLIDDLLQYSRVGKRKMNLKPIDINQIVELKLRDLSERIKEKNAIIEVNNLPTQLLCDATQLSIVFFNLINNGLKFNNSEQPKITIQCEERPKEWVFVISDNGIGIERKNQKQIFEIFKRLHRKEEYDGTGIGLAIVKRVVIRHLGQIWLKSKLGQGTTFYFSISKNLTVDE